MDKNKFIELMSNAAPQPTPNTPYIIDNAWAIKFCVKGKLDAYAFLHFNRHAAMFMDYLETVNNEYSEVALPPLRRAHKKHRERMDYINSQENLSDDERYTNIFNATYDFKKEFSKIQVQIFSTLAKNSELECNILRIDNIEYHGQRGILDLV